MSLLHTSLNLRNGLPVFLLPWASSPYRRSSESLHSAHMTEPMQSMLRENCLDVVHLGPPEHIIVIDLRPWFFYSVFIETFTRLF